MNAVSDASPLIVLARIGRFDLLTKLYQTIYISSEVYAEVTVSGAGLPGASLVANADWIEVKPIKNRLALLELQRNTGLDIGELGAIILARETEVETILIDEAAGRKLAQQHGLEVRGVVGILETLFLRGEILDLNAVFANLLANAYIDRKFLNHRLHLLGRPPLD